MIESFNPWYLGVVTWALYLGIFVNKTSNENRVYIVCDDGSVVNIQLALSLFQGVWGGIKMVIVKQEYENDKEEMVFVTFKHIDNKDTQPGSRTAWSDWILGTSS